MTTSGGFAERIKDPGFTPGIRTLADLLELVGSDDEDLAKLATRAVLRIEAQYAAKIADAVVAKTQAATRPARGRLTALAGRIAAEDRDPKGAAKAWLVEAVADADPKTRRAAVRALGNLTPTPEMTATLRAAHDGTTNEEDKKALGLALGKAGVSTGQTGRAGLIALREEARKAPGAIDVSRTLPKARIRFYTRSGLEEVMKDEISRSTKFIAPGIVETTLPGPLSDALAIRTALDVGFPLENRKPSADLVEDVASALTGDEALAIFRAFSVGATIRFRLAFVHGGHQRSIVWKIAESIQQRTKELVNDPKESTWEVSVDVAGPTLKLTLFPRGFVDERFTYRQDVVPASSHPVMAAALARLAPRHKDDVIWDPFVGAGAELVERARLGPYGRLYGTDVEQDAVIAARANLQRAGVERALVEKGDALDPLVPPDGVTVIITNPPMGRRVQRGTHADLLDRFVERAFEVLEPGGALVWLAPDPPRSRAKADSAGFVLERGTSVDMGGFSAELSVYIKPKTRPQTRAEARKTRRQ